MYRDRYSLPGIETRHLRDQFLFRVATVQPSPRNLSTNLNRRSSHLVDLVSGTQVNERDPRLATARAKPVAEIDLWALQLQACANSGKVEVFFQT